MKNHSKHATTKPMMSDRLIYRQIDRQCLFINKAIPNFLSR